MQDFPWFGTGLGTYGQSMLVYQTAGREEIYLQAHNDYVQVAAEGGLLLVVPAAILLTYIIRTIWRRMRGGDDSVLSGWLRAGAVAGLVGIAAQSLVEFSLQMPGNAVWFVLLAAIAMHRPSRSSSARRV
jgi:O-antigen ligase